VERESASPATEHIAVNSDGLPWAPVPGTPGQWFKLLHVDERTGGVTALLRIEPGTVTPVHEHFGATEIFTLQGHWGEDDLPGGFRPGGFLYEAHGYKHQEPPPDEEIILFARSEGQTQSFADDGQPMRLVGAELLRKVWERHLTSGSTG
jgi:anti-sigma factor ChrR (cupin superfamily)